MWFSSSSKAHGLQCFYCMSLERRDPYTAACSIARNRFHRIEYDCISQKERLSVFDDKWTVRAVPLVCFETSIRSVQTWTSCLLCLTLRLHVNFKVEPFCLTELLNSAYTLYFQELEEFITSVTGIINKCIDDVVPTVNVRTYSKQTTSALSQEYDRILLQQSAWGGIYMAVIITD